MPDKMNSRSKEQEIMDDLDLASDDLNQTLHDIERLNRLFGGHRSVIKGLDFVLKSSESLNRSQRLIEVGCGLGDNLAVARRKFGSVFTLTGIDANPFIIEKAREKHGNLKIDFVQKKMNMDDFLHLDADIVLMGLFIHHFDKSQIVEMLMNLKKSKVKYIIISDLKRSTISLILYKFIGSILGLNSMAKYDGALSIRKGFKYHELNKIAAESGIQTGMIKPTFAFRYLMVLNNSDEGN